MPLLGKDWAQPSLIGGSEMTVIAQAEDGRQSDRLLWEHQPILIDGFANAVSES